MNDFIWFRITEIILTRIVFSLPIVWKERSRGGGRTVGAESGKDAADDWKGLSSLQVRHYLYAGFWYRVSLAVLDGYKPISPGDRPTKIEMRHRRRPCESADCWSTIITIQLCFCFMWPWRSVHFPWLHRSWRRGSSLKRLRHLQLC